MRDSVQMRKLSSERSALKWQFCCDGRCHRDSPVTEKLIDGISSDMSGDKAERSREAANKVVPRKNISFRL